MSESDDTDLLLLIPPDFFVIHSDSEDSVGNYQKDKNNHRFNELMSHVNQLEERINFIESKDSNRAECFSETNYMNQSVDYSFSFDASDRNVLSNDLALRYYSLESGGSKFNCNNDYASIDHVEHGIQNSLINKVHHTLRNSFPGSSEHLVDFEPHLEISSRARPIFMETLNQPGNSNIIHSNTPSNVISRMPTDELNSSCGIISHSEQSNISFLKEIDEFLENKNKQTFNNLHCNIPIDVSEQRKFHINKLKTEVENLDDAEKYIISSKHWSSVSKSFDTKQFDVGQVSESTEVDICPRLKHHYCDSNCGVISYIDNVNEQTKVEECEQLFPIQQNNEEKNLTNENSNNENIISFQGSNSKRLNENSVHVSSDSKVSKERKLKEFVDKHVNETCSQLGFKTRSQSSSDIGDSESVRRSGVIIKAGKEDFGNEIWKTSLQYENLISASNNTNVNGVTGDKTLYLPQCEDKIRCIDNYIEDTNFSEVTSETWQSKNLIQLKDNLPVSNHYRTAMSTDLPIYANTEVTLGSKSSNDKIKKTHEKETQNEVNSKVPHFSLNSIDNDHIESFRRLKVAKDANVAKKKSDDSVILPMVDKYTHGLQNKSNEHTGIATARSSEREFIRKHTHNQYERNKMSHKLVDDFNKVGPFMDDGYYSSAGTGSSAANFLSLHDLWGKEAKDMHKREALTIEQKLEEEYCRRQHCENLIQQLQCSILELQQKLAVAMRVDRSKDLTIQQLQTAWKRLANHWQELEEQRHALSVKFSEEKEKHQQNAIGMSQKVKQLELELSKALDLAKGYKEKSDIMESTIKKQEISFAQEKEKLQVSIKEEQNRVIETEKKLTCINNEMKNMKEKLETAEKVAHDEKEVSEKLLEEIKDVQKELENLETDMSMVKEENLSLRLRLKEERARNDILDQQMKSLKIGLDESKKKEKLLQNDLKERTNILEKTKAELRDYYQQQVEIVVQEKLVEFQNQLDAAETSLHQEMEQKEKIALENASKQIKHITEKNLLEVKLLEEKHKEELHLCKLQLTQAAQQINQLQAQLQSYSNRKIEIVEKLHSVMETQWQEALRIISGGSPVQHFQEQHCETTEKNISDKISDKDIKLLNEDCNAVPPLHVPHSSSSSTTDEIPFNKEDQLTFRANNEQQCNHNSVFCPDNADAVKKYIEMLLNQAPGNTVDNEASSERPITEEMPVCEGRIFPNWEKFLESQQILYENGKSFPCCSSEDSKFNHTQNSKPNKPCKPPWK